MGLVDYLDWEENVFVGLKRSFEYLFVSPKNREREERTCHLEHCRAELTLLARMFSGQAVDIFVTDDALLLVEDQICLPPRLSVAGSPDENKFLYLFKTMVGALCLGGGVRGPVGMSETANILTDLPGVPPELMCWAQSAEAMFEEAEGLWRFVGSIPERSTRENAPPLLPLDELDESSCKEEARTELEGKGKVDVELVTLEKGPEHEMPIHTFEKVETLEEYTGVNRKDDSTDELKEQEEALSALDLRHLVRTPDRSNAFYTADVGLDSVALDARGCQSDAGIPYPEWDYRKREYRQQWAWVSELRDTAVNPQWILQARQNNRRVLEDLKRRFRRVATENERRRNQIRGDDFDLDVVTDNEVRRLAKFGCPEERIYIERKKADFDIATTVLFDLSYSIDGWLAGRHLLEVVRNLVFCLGETLDEHNTSFSIAGFSSNTRRECFYQQVKRFSESWTAAQGRIGSLQPKGYTRVGPALRHSIHLMSETSERRKLIFLVTDGKPCDYDRYEGSYGIHDVRRAVQEAKEEGIYVHAFAVDPSAKMTFPRMFSPGGYHVVTDCNQLAVAVLDAYLKGAAFRG